MRKVVALAALATCLSVGSLASAQEPPPGYAPPPAGYAPPPAGYAPPPGYAPAPGYAPPGYAPPGYPAPPGYAAPPPVYYAPGPAAQGPKYMDYEEGQPVPAGYHVRTSARKGVAIAGGAVLGAFWILGIISGMTLAVVDDANNRHTERSAILFVPVAGPWVGMSTLHPESATATLGLAFLGIGQTLGAGLLIGGLASQKTELVRNDIGSAKPHPKLTLAPMFSLQNTGLRGTF